LLHAGLDLSRRGIDVCLVSAAGEVVEGFASPPDADGVVGLARRVGRHALPVRGVIESMTGARCVPDRLEGLGRDGLIAGAAKVKGLAPFGCTTDEIDARVLALLSHRDVVPEIWPPDPRLRRERALARCGMQLVKHRSMLEHRSHATPISFGHPCPVGDPFGVAGREPLDRLDVQRPGRGTVAAGRRLIDDLDRQIDAIHRELRASGADHRSVPRLLSVPGIGWVPAFPIAAEIGDLHRLASARQPCGHTGLCPRVYRSGDRDSRGPLTRQGPKHPRWAMPEATMPALRHPAYRERYPRNRRRLGRQRGAQVARIDVARTRTEAIWHMLTHDQPFAPAPGGPAFGLAARRPSWTSAPEPAADAALSCRRAGHTEMSAARPPRTRGGTATRHRRRP
jgi:transposase